MPTNLLIVYYSMYGHVYQMARAVAEGGKAVGEVDVRLRRVAEFEEVAKKIASQEWHHNVVAMQQDIQIVTHDDLRWADGICWGTPTRYGNMAAQMKQFIDTTGNLWQKGELEDKAAGIFVSTATIHGGQESTALTTMVPLLHLGM